MSRTICVVTGSRAEYGLLESPMRHIQSSRRLELSLVVTGMHLSARHGNTISLIEDEFEIDRTVEMLLDGDSGSSMAKSTGIGTMGLADAFEEIEPDIVLVLGDRDEPLAAAIAAAHMNIPIAHIHGGDVMAGATIDDSIRYALTKFSHIHFPASPDSAERVANLGEENWRIQIVGAPGLDDIIDGDFVSGEDARNKFDIEPDCNLILCVQHPVTTEPEEAADQMRATLNAVEDFDASVVIIYPNSDAGGQSMIEVIEARAATPQLRTYKSLPREQYLGLMDAADVMVGNSSSGIIESPSFDLPVVDVGPRQERRQRGDNVRSVPHDEAAIREAIDAALNSESVREKARKSENPYDYGGSGRQIASFLEDVEINKRLQRKSITF